MPRPDASPYPRRRLVAWCLYDFGMATFSMVVVTAFFVVRFKDVVAAGSRRADFLWGLAVSLSMAGVALLAPVLGAVADLAGRRRPFLVGFALLCMAATAALSLPGQGDVALALVLFGAGYLGYAAAMPFYNAFLEDVAPRERFAQVSGLGWGLGYLGGLLSLLLLLPLAPRAVTAAGDGEAALILCGTAALFLLAALPAFLLLRDRAPRPAPPEGFLRAGFARLAATLRHARGEPDLWRTLLGFFLFNDAITTVVAFFAVYAKDSLGFSVKESALLLLAVQVTASAGAFASGWLGARLGLRRTVVGFLGVWIAAVLGAYLAESRGFFLGVSIVAGTALGGSQAAARALVADLAEPARRTEIFGFMAVAGKLAALFGPLLFGAVSSFAGSQRLAILSVEVFFVAGLLVLLKVRHP